MVLPVSLAGSHRIRTISACPPRVLKGQIADGMACANPYPEISPGVDRLHADKTGLVAAMIEFAAYTEKESGR